MRLKELLIISRGTKVIIGITFSVSLLAIVFAFFYYRSINRAEDPRVRKAREALFAYDQASGGINSFEAFHFLDSASVCYWSLPDYATSFEIGLIFNNKCSALLLMALYDSTAGEPEKTRLLNLSKRYCDSSIVYYRNWLDEWEGLSREDIHAKVIPFMHENDPVFNGLNFDKVVSGRIKYIETAQTETPRRLSVSLTNKGTIYRHKLMPDSALLLYQEALTLWKDNRAVKSNMSVLLGGEPVNPSFIESLFPPDRNKR